MPVTQRIRMMSGLLRLLRSKWSPPAKTTSTFNGKTVVITGSNTGLGFQAARTFLELSASHVVLAVRNTSKGDIARKQLEAQTGRDGAISVLELDMNNFTSVKSFAGRVSRQFKSIDIVILNAGLHNREYVTSPEGWEETLQVNTLSTTLLALLLLPKLRSVRPEASASLPHLVLVSSGLHTGVARSSLPSPPQNILSALDTPPEPAAAFNGGRQYAVSKLFLMYAVKSLASLATSPSGEPQIIVTSCCPGFCVSELGRQYSSWFEGWAKWAFYGLFARSTEDGARTLVGASTLGVEAQGGYLTNGELQTPGEMVVSHEGKEIQKQVWKEIVDVLKAKVPEVENLAVAAK